MQTCFGFHFAHLKKQGYAPFAALFTTRRRAVYSCSRVHKVDETNHHVIDNIDATARPERKILLMSVCPCHWRVLVSFDINFIS